jgi:hypothetical protein
MTDNPRSTLKSTINPKSLVYFVGVLFGIAYGAISPFAFDDGELTQVARFLEILENNQLLSAVIAAIVLAACIAVAVFLAWDVANQSWLAASVNRLFFITVLAAALGTLISLALGFACVIELPPYFGFFIFGSVGYFATGLTGIMAMRCFRKEDGAAAGSIENLDA